MARPKKDRKPFETPSWTERVGNKALERPPLVRIPQVGEMDVTPEEVLRWGGLLHAEELKFLKLVARGYDSQDAAVLIGRDAKDGPGLQERLFSMKVGIAYTRMLQAQMVAGTLVGLSLNRLKDLITQDEDKRTALQAIRTALDAAAWFGSRAEARDMAMRAIGEDPTAVTPEELAAQAAATRQEIARLESMAAALKAGAEVVEGEVVEVEAGDPPASEDAPWD